MRGLVAVILVFAAIWGGFSPTPISASVYHAGYSPVGALKAQAAITRNKYGEIVSGPKVVKTLFDEIAPKYADRTGGYTRIIKLAKHRIGDGTSLCVLQLVGDEDMSAPQVSGQYSRRRDKANKRMEFAAAKRKGGSDVATAVAEPEAEEQADTPVEEAAAEETTSEEATEAQADDAEEKKSE